MCKAMSMYEQINNYYNSSYLVDACYPSGLNSEYSSILDFFRETYIENEKVLEVGCCNGVLTLNLENIVGSDNLEAVDILKNKVDDAEFFLKSKVYNIDILNYESEIKYSHIFLIDLVEHINPDKIEDLWKKINELSSSKVHIWIRIPNPIWVKSVDSEYLNRPGVDQAIDLYNLIALAYKNGLFLKIIKEDNNNPEKNGILLVFSNESNVSVTLNDKSIHKTLLDGDNYQSDFNIDANNVKVGFWSSDSETPSSLIDIFESIGNNLKVINFGKIESKKEFIENLKLVDFIVLEKLNVSKCEYTQYLAEKPVVLKLNKKDVKHEFVNSIYWQNIDHLVFDSDQTESKFKSHFPKIYEFISSKFCIYDVVNTDIIDSIDTGRNEFNVAWCGDISYKDGMDSLIQIINKIVDKDNKFQFHLSGNVIDPEVGEYVTYLVKKLGIHNNVHFYKKLSFEERISLFKQCNFLIFTQLYNDNYKYIAEGVFSGCKTLTIQGVDNHIISKFTHQFNTIDEAADFILFKKPNLTNDIYSEKKLSFKYNLNSLVDILIDSLNKYYNGNGDLFYINNISDVYRQNLLLLIDFQKLFIENKVEEAWNLFCKIDLTEFSIKHTNITYLLAIEVALLRDDYETALTLCEKTIEIDSNEPALINAVGRALWACGFHKEALESLKFSADIALKGDEKFHIEFNLESILSNANEACLFFGLENESKKYTMN